MYRRKVRFSDTDCQGHVFNANYFVYVDDAITDYLDELGLPYAEIVQRGHDMVLARAECDFRSATELGETVEVEVSVTRLGNTSLTFGFVASAAGDGRTVAQGQEVYVILDHASGTPTPVPTYLREAVAAAAATDCGLKDDVRASADDLDRSAKSIGSLQKDPNMIGRIWHGWTTPENADSYENLLKTEIFPGIASNDIEGYRGIQLLRRPADGEVEFITIMMFDSLDAVKRFAGQDYEQAYVPPKARQLLLRFDDLAMHYELREQITCK